MILLMLLMAACEGILPRQTGSYPVSEVKNERNCNASYIFAAVSAFETKYAQVNNLSQAINFSEQWVLSNSTQTRCTYGTPDTSLSFMQSTGICVEPVYPYYGLKILLPFKNVQLYRIATYENRTGIENFFEDLNKTALVVGFEIDNYDNFLGYSGDIYNCSGSGTGVIHYMLAVASGSTDYVLLKNNWGLAWGDNGYMNLSVTESEFGPCNIFLTYYIITQLEGEIDR
jgi:hypothetical protein